MFPLPEAMSSYPLAAELKIEKNFVPSTNQHPTHPALPESHPYYFFAQKALRQEVHCSHQNSETLTDLVTTQVHGEKTATPSHSAPPFQFSHQQQPDQHLNQLPLGLPQSAQ